MTPTARQAAETVEARDHTAAAWALLEAKGFGGNSLERQPKMDQGKHWRTAARDRLQAAMDALDGKEKSDERS